MTLCSRPCISDTSVASFTKEVNPRLTKRPLEINGRLANRELPILSKRGYSLFHGGAKTKPAISKKPSYWGTGVDGNQSTLKCRYNKKCILFAKKKRVSWQTIDVMPTYLYGVQITASSKSGYPKILIHRLYLCVAATILCKDSYSSSSGCLGDMPYWIQTRRRDPVLM